MTFPDDSRDEPGQGPPDGQTEPELPFDEDAAWRAIVENYGERPDLGASSSDPVTDPSPGPVGPGSVAPPARGVFDRGYLDSQASGPADKAPDEWSEEAHFEPPEPPPVPRATPARRLAWCGLFGAPLLMLVAVVAHLTFPMWLSMGLVAAFVGGFVFLVATMDRTGGDGWGGDDGAVV